MRLTVIGCAGSFPNADSPASCYLIEHDGFGLLLDLGSGALGPLAAVRDLAAVDAVAFSHMHPDHCADICGLYVRRRYDPAGPLPSIPVLGPTGVATRVDEMYGLAGTRESMSSVFDFLEYADEPIQVGPFQVSVRPVCHCVEAFAIRVSADGRSVVYSGDTGPCPALVELAGGADLAIFEASNVSTRDDPPNLHMSGQQAAQAATQARARALLLTHFVAWNDTAEVMAEARPEFAGELIEARAGLAIEIGDLG